MPAISQAESDKAMREMQRRILADERKKLETHEPTVSDALELAGDVHASLKAELAFMKSEFEAAQKSYKRHIQIAELEAQTAQRELNRLKERIEELDSRLRRVNL